MNLQPGNTGLVLGTQIDALSWMIRLAACLRDVPHAVAVASVAMDEVV